ncbi:hypothetical protein [Streptomyces sp. NPDC058695]|uniref:hypothetical protein n=1 Tax=Streptomyces sp. NPDC058695 TaxID=3346604 RepID=UPI00365E860B
MTAPTPPALDCPTNTPTDPYSAPQAVDATTVGEPKGAARQGVVIALPRSKRFPREVARPTSSDPTPEQPGIRIYAPPVYRHHYDGARWSKRHGDTPTAAYACGCGEADSAVGPESVAALLSDYEAHKSACTGTSTATQEGRAAA